LREGEEKARGFARQMRQAMPGAEVVLWSRLRRWPGAKFRRQHPIGPYIADFACIAARLVVEVDGETHGSAAERARDAVRDRYLQKQGWRVLRVWNRDVYRRLDDVLEAVARNLPPPPLRGTSPVNGGGCKQ
jgi:very-short-patch-repair endonuclease